MTNLDSVAQSVAYKTLEHEVAGSNFQVFSRIDESHCDSIHSSLTFVYCFEDGYMEKQPVAWKEYCANYWLKELRESIYFLPSHWLLSHVSIAETTDSGEREMNPVAMTIINPRKEYWQSRGSNQRPPVRSPQRYRLSYLARHSRMYTHTNLQSTRVCIHRPFLRTFLVLYSNFFYV